MLARLFVVDLRRIFANSSFEFFLVDFGFVSDNFIRLDFVCHGSIPLEQMRNPTSHETFGTTTTNARTCTSIQ